MLSGDRRPGFGLSDSYPNVGKSSYTMKLFAVLTVLAGLWVFASGQTLTPTYEELVAMNVSCSPKDTCVRELSKSRDLPNPVDRNCACDSACALYGDCCVDAPSRPDNPPPPATSLGWTCRNLTQFGGIIMKNTCPVNWTGPADVRAGCESAVETDVVPSDPFSAMPVTNRLTGTTYVNFQCAFCNGDTADSLIWLPRLEFETLSPYNNTYHNVTGDYIKRNMEYLPGEKTWGIRLYGVDGFLYDYPAKLYPMIPREVETLVRPCRRSLVSTCDSAWLDSMVTAKCKAYEAAIYLHDLSKNVGYRNAHCALCNFVQPSDLVCRPPSAKSDVEQRTFNFQALSLLVDFNDARGNQVGQTDLCYDGEIYDPFQKKCRNVVCGFPGYVLVNNKCVLQRASTTVTPDPPSTATPEITITSTEATSTAAPSTTTVPTTEEPTTTQSPTTEEQRTVETTAVWEETTMLPLTYDTNTTEDGDLQVVTLSRNDSSSTTESPRREEKSNTKSASMREATLSPEPTYSQDFIECPKVPVQMENVRTLSNGSIYVISYDRYYEPFQYLLLDNQILVCAFFINDTQTNQAKFSLVLGYITVVGLSISMFFLMLHLIAYFVVPDLQNFSTRNLSSFALALFFAYFCFTIGNISTLSKLSCTTLAVTTSYFFLVSFFWMNAMSYDVWRTLRLATRELRVNGGKQWRRFVLYSLYAWGFPAGIVTAAVVVDNVEGVPPDYRPGFGVRLCWFTERKALLVFFATPLIAIMMINIGFFVSSAKMILSTSHATANNYSASSRRNFKLYLRLGVMMGLTWTFGVVAGYLDLETLWYVFIVFNALQGLFIFVAFTCNRKVRKYLVDRCESIRKGRQAYRTSSLNSGSAFNSNSTFPSNNSTSKTMSSQLNETKSTIMSPEKLPQAAPLTSPPDRSITTFKHLQAGMETLY